MKKKKKPKKEIIIPFDVMKVLHFLNNDKYFKKTKKAVIK